MSEHVTIKNIYQAEVNSSDDERDSALNQSVSFNWVGKKSPHYGVGITIANEGDTNSIFSEKEEDLSMISIGPAGIIEQPTIRTQTIYGQLLDLNEHYATVECLMDVKHRIYKSKQIRRDVLEGVIPLVPGQLIIVQLKDKKGQHVVEYVDGSNITPKEYFDTSIYFQGEYTNKPAK